jgi:hypothetical protein
VCEDIWCGCSVFLFVSRCKLILHLVLSFSCHIISLSPGFIIYRYQRLIRNAREHLFVHRHDHQAVAHCFGTDLLSVRQCMESSEARDEIMVQYLGQAIPELFLLISRALKEENLYSTLVL